MTLAVLEWPLLINHSIIALNCAGLELLHDSACPDFFKNVRSIVLNTS